MLRYWRLLILAGAVLLAPQMALVHALSHSLPHTAHHQGDGDQRHHVAATVCGSCLAFAQLGAALPSRFDSAARLHALPALADASAMPVAVRQPTAFDARAPPAALT